MYRQTKEIAPNLIYIYLLFLQNGFRVEILFQKTFTILDKMKCGETLHILISVRIVCVR